jgi:hypothetical protein
MAENYNYLRPKVRTGNLSDRKIKNGMFQNPPSFPQLAGFYGPSKLFEPNRPLTLEKGDLTRKGKPV